PVDALDPYLPDLRRSLRPYWSVVRSGVERRRAARAIMDSAQKGVLDLPARYLHPPFENFLAARLSATPVTPNQITVLTAILAFTATYLFATGGYGWALVLALVTNVLDGVDGKLARVKLKTSRFGDLLDHTLDVTFEFTWYLALGWGLSGGDLRAPLFLVGPALILVMLGTRAVSGVYKSLTGRQIHDHTAFDRAVRLVAGRRNIYVMLLLGGYLMDRMAEAFVLCLVWGIVTLAVYKVRAFMAWLGRDRG
ncbi:MAG: CDP-alcohol phosphatidyltransferase family protein, partial [Gemmatimonadetes bacterium]